MTTLENHYEWQTPLTVAGIPVIILVAWLAVSQAPGWWAIAFAFFLMWAMYAGMVWLRTRGALSIDEDATLHVRRWFRTHEVRVGEVAKVKELFNGRSPDVILITKDRRKVIVPTSKLEKGHSALFLWLSEAAEDAVYDKGATKLRDRLRAGGYLDGTRPFNADDNWGIGNVRAGFVGNQWGGPGVQEFPDTPGKRKVRR